MAQVVASLVRGSTGIRPFVSDRAIVDPIQELANLLAPEVLDRDSTAPLLPLPKGRVVLVLRSTCQLSGTKILRHSRVESRWHFQVSNAAGDGFNARSSWPVAF